MYIKTRAVALSIVATAIVIVEYNSTIQFYNN